jgi:hypothetical protein
MGLRMLVVLRHMVVLLRLWMIELLGGSYLICGIYCLRNRIPVGSWSCVSLIRTLVLVLGSVIVGCMGDVICSVRILGLVGDSIRFRLIINFPATGRIRIHDVSCGGFVYRGYGSEQWSFTEYHYKTTRGITEFN